MTDTEMQRRKAICDIAGVDDIGELSDGFHTFNGLYKQRMNLFAELVKAYLADGCVGCAFMSTEEWEMPCRKCKRNSKDYWRANDDSV